MAEGKVSAPFLFVLMSPQSSSAMRWMWDILKDDCGVDKSECRLVYVIEEEPEGANFKPTKTQLANHAQRFRREMEESKPKVVVPLGPDAFRAVVGVLPSSVGIEDARGYCLTPAFFGTTLEKINTQIGTYATSNKTRGIKKGDPKYKLVSTKVPPPMPKNYTGVVIPAYSQIQVQKSGFKLSYAFKADLIRAAKAARGTLRMQDTFVYARDIVGANGDDYDTDLLAFDIETLGIGSDVVDRISFSDGQRTHTIPWNADTKVWVQRQFDLAAKNNTLLVGHNLMFDIPRLRMAGIVFPENARFYDTMLAGVMLQPDLPKGLGRMAPLYLNITPWKWRHLSEADPEFYSAKDSYITALLAREQIDALREIEEMVS